MKDKISPRYLSWFSISIIAKKKKCKKRKKKKERKLKEKKVRKKTKIGTLLAENSIRVMNSIQVYKNKGRRTYKTEKKIQKEFKNETIKINKNK